METRVRLAFLVDGDEVKCRAVKLWWGEEWSEEEARFIEVTDRFLDSHKAIQALFRRYRVELTAPRRYQFKNEEEV